MTDSMRALVLPAIGEQLEERDVPRPIAARGEVLVRIAASGVNPLDTKIRIGAAAHARVTAPAILGIDMAGTVESMGEGVTGFSLGDEVYGMTGGVGNVQGSLAEYAAVDARLLAHKPARLSMAEAAALPLAAISAWEGLVDRAQVRAGQTVLVLGGAGGVGSIAIELAVSRGANVVATGSRTSAERISALGAAPADRDRPLDEVVAEHTAGEGFDIVFDAVGGAALDAAFTAVKRYTGHVVSILGWGTHALAPLSFRGATYSGVFTLMPLITGEGREHHGEILKAIAGLVDVGAISPRLSASTYDWASVEDAHEAVRAGTAGGKVVVTSPAA